MISCLRKTVKLLPLLFFLIITISAKTQTQNLADIIKQADSSAKSSDLGKAKKLYADAIKMVVNDEINISNNFEWIKLLNSAASTEQKDGNWHMAQKYWNMAYGSHGEKLIEKIQLLKELGINQIFTFYSFNEGASKVIIQNRCSSNITKYLIWGINGNCYIQAFDECDTYKTLMLRKSALLNFYNTHVRQLTKEQIKPFGYKGSDMEEFEFEFLFEDKIFKKRFNIAYDLTEPKYTKEQLTIPSLKNSPQIYGANIRTNLSKLLPMVLSEVKKYNEMILSGKEKGRAGKL